MTQPDLEAWAPVAAIGVLLLQAAMLGIMLRRRRMSLGRRRGQRAASRCEALLPQGLLDGLEAHLCVLDGEARIVQHNFGWIEFAVLANPDADSGVGASFADFCRESGVYRGAAPRELARAAREVCAGRLERFEGEFEAVVSFETRSMRLKIAPLISPGRPAAVVTQVDLSGERESQTRLLEEKNRAEAFAAALETSHQSLELAVRGANLGLWHWDLAAGYFGLCEECLPRLGYQEEELDAEIGAFRDLIHPEDRELISNEVASRLGCGEMLDAQIRLRRADGSYAWFHALGRPNAADPEGAAEALSGVLIDIDATKRSEQRDAELATILDQSLNEVYFIDRVSGLYLGVNRGARENLGHTSEWLQGKPPEAVCPAFDSASLGRFACELEADGCERLEFETVHHRRDNSVYPVMVSVQRARYLGREALVVFAVDLTQRNRLESRVRHAQKLDSLGNLAAGVAHEMNTPLQCVSLNLEFLQNGCGALEEFFACVERLPDAEPLGELRQTMADSRFRSIRDEMPRAVEETRDNAERALTIVRSMRAFSHPGGEGKSGCDLNSIASSSATITRGRWKHTADLLLDLDPRLPHVECEPGSINQVLVNLIVNAVDAVAERHGPATHDGEPSGRIELRTRVVDDRVTIEVEDNGCGMSEEVRTKMFDPFYTTKGVGEGTGQGLMLCHAIVVQNHGGEIEVLSEPGSGTTVRVVLPIRSPAMHASRESEGAARLA